MVRPRDQHATRKIGEVIPAGYTSGVRRNF